MRFKENEIIQSKKELDFFLKFWELIFTLYETYYIVLNRIQRLKKIINVKLIL